MKPSVIAAIVIPVGLAIIAFCLYWFLFRSTSLRGNPRKLKLTSMVFQQPHKESLHGTLANKAIRTVSFETCVPDTPSSVKCDGLPVDWQVRTREFLFNGTVEGQYKFTRHDTTDLVVPLEKLSGELLALYLVPEDDMWSTEFDLDSKEDINAQFATMKQNLEHAICLFGDLTKKKGVKFDLTTESDLTLQAVDLTALGKLSNRPGVFRASLKHLDYDVVLNKQVVRVRILLSNCNGPHGGRFGDKLLFINGSYQWLDMRNKAFVTHRNPFCLTFWNQLFEAEKDHGYQLDQQKHFERTMNTYFNANRYGMPVYVANRYRLEDVETKTMVLDLLPNTHVSFCGTPLSQVEEAELLKTPEEILMRFRIPSFCLNAHVYFE